MLDSCNATVERIDGPDAGPGDSPATFTSALITPTLALRPREAARAIGISERALWSLTKDQTSGIPHIHFGRCVVYPVRELRDWLADRTSRSTQNERARK